MDMEQALPRQMEDGGDPSSGQTETAKEDGTEPNPDLLPYTKTQMYADTRSTCSPPPKRRRRRRWRTCCCCCCCSTVLIMAILLLLTATAGAVVYLIYRPQGPSFSVSSLKISYLNVTPSSTIISKFDVNITVRNPNDVVTFSYDPISVSVFSRDVDVADGSLPPFVQEENNTTLLNASLVNRGNQVLDSEAANELMTSLQNTSGFPMQIRLDTKMKMKMGGLRTPEVGIRVTCKGVNATSAAGKAPAAAPNHPKCGVDIRIKIWKWTV